MKVFYHHMYEYQKGLRKLFLCTMDTQHETKVKKRLEKNNIDYIIHSISDKKMNVFFGDSLCIEVVRRFNTIRLNELSHEQDYILGTMLGYDISVQCKRYLDRTDFKKKIHILHGA